uniref:Uncharacterized protein n=1 Tax=Anguilla anguilla TaxID=7936 RepID=A0A0E9W5G3_ANGAN
MWFLQYHFFQCIISSNAKTSVKC